MTGLTPVLCLQELYGLDLLVGVTGTAPGLVMLCCVSFFSFLHAAHARSHTDKGVVCVLAWNAGNLRFEAKQRFRVEPHVSRRAHNMWRVSVDASGTALGVECLGKSVALFTATPPEAHDLAAPLCTQRHTQVACVMWCSVTMALDAHLHVLCATHDGVATWVLNTATPRSSASSDNGSVTTMMSLDSRSSPPVGLLPCPPHGGAHSGLVLALCVNHIHVLRVSSGGLAATSLVVIRHFSNGGSLNAEVVPTAWTWGPSLPGMRDTPLPDPVLLLGVTCGLQSCVLAFTLDVATGVLTQRLDDNWRIAHDIAAMCLLPASDLVLIFGSGGTCSTISLGHVDQWGATQMGDTHPERWSLSGRGPMPRPTWRGISAPCLAVDTLPGFVDTVRLLCGSGCGDGPSALRTCTLAAPVTQRALGPPSRDMRSLTGMWVIPPAAHRVDNLGGSILVLGFVEATRLMRLDAGQWVDITDSTSCVADTRSIAAGVVAGELVQVCAHGVLVLGPLAAPSALPGWAWAPPPGESISVAQVCGDVVVVATSRTWQLFVLTIAPHPDGRRAVPGLCVVATTALPSEPSCMHITPGGQLASSFVGATVPPEARHDAALLTVGTYQPGLVLLALSVSRSSLSLVASLSISGGEGPEHAMPRAHGNDPVAAHDNDLEAAIPHAVLVTCAGYSPQGAPRLPCTLVSLRDGRLLRFGQASNDIMERHLGRVPASLIPMDNHSVMALSDVPWVLSPVDGAQCFTAVPCVSPLAFTASAGVVLPWEGAAPLLGGAPVPEEATPVLVCDGDTLRLLMVHAPGVHVDEFMAVHGRPCAALASHACITHAGVYASLATPSVAEYLDSVRLAAAAAASGSLPDMAASGRAPGPRMTYWPCQRPLALMAITDHRSGDASSPRSELFAVDVQTQKAMVDGMRLREGERFSCVATWRGRFAEPRHSTPDSVTLMTQLVLAGTSGEPSIVPDGDEEGRLLVMCLRFIDDADDTMDEDEDEDDAQLEAVAACEEEVGDEKWHSRMGNAQWQILAEARLPGPVTAVCGAVNHHVAVACGQSVYVLRLVPPVQWVQDGEEGSGDEGWTLQAASWALVKLPRPQRPALLRGTVTALCWLAPGLLCISDDWDGVALLHFGSEASARPTVIQPRPTSRQRLPPPAEPVGRDTHPRVAHIAAMQTAPFKGCSAGVCAVSTDGMAHIYTLRVAAPGDNGPTTAAQVSLVRTASFVLDGVATCVNGAWSASSGDILYIGTALGALVRLRRVDSSTFAELAALEERLAEHEVTMPICTRPPSSPAGRSEPPGLAWHRTVRGGSVAERRILDGDLLTQFVSLPASLQAEVALAPDLVTPPLDMERMHRCLAALALLQQPVGALEGVPPYWCAAAS